MNEPVHLPPSDFVPEIARNDGFSQHHKEMLRREVSRLELKLAELKAEVGRRKAWISEVGSAKWEVHP